MKPSCSYMWLILRHVSAAFQEASLSRNYKSASRSREVVITGCLRMTANKAVAVPASCVCEQEPETGAKTRHPILEANTCDIVSPHKWQNQATSPRSQPLEGRMITALQHRLNRRTGSVRRILSIPDPSLGSHLCIVAGLLLS